MISLVYAIMCRFKVYSHSVCLLITVEFVMCFVHKYSRAIPYCHGLWLPILPIMAHYGAFRALWRFLKKKLLFQTIVVSGVCHKHSEGL